jgi:hypothetical protein
MLSDKALMESIFETALRGCNVDVAARADALWDATVCLQADVLRTLDPFNRERRLRGLVSELRKSIATIDELLKPRPTVPRSPYDFT